MTITAEIMTVSPKKAEDWLSANTHNRPLRNRQVEFLRGVIERGEWQLNGDAVRFDADGTLIDGQHRLWAIALGETSVKMMVVRGLASDAQMTIDMGARRSLADHLRLEGYTNASRLAALMVAKWRWDNDLYQTTARPTIAQAMAVLEDNPTLVDSCKVWAKGHLTYHSSVGAIGLLHYECSSIDEEAADEFFDRLADGVGLAKDSPILHLRERLIVSRLSAVMQAALTIKAWNAYVEGRKVEKLLWRAVGSQAEAFPELVA